MQYRELGKTGLKISEIGLGCESFAKDEGKVARDLIEESEKLGVNYFDLYTPDPTVRRILGKVLEGKRDKFIIQAHLCTSWENNQYERTRDIKKVKYYFEDLLEQLHTDYVDVGMIHYVDSMEDLENILNGPIIEYLLGLKEAGKVHFTGISSHNPVVAQAAVETGLIDVLMFSINPFYDLQPPSEDVEDLFNSENYQREMFQLDPDRERLYEYCQNNGIGITVMKAFGGGRLLDENLSHVEKALTVEQALHYCLTRPGVSSVLVGAESVEELNRSVAYEEASDELKDYAPVLDSISNISLKGDCMYCGHCAPCPKEIDVASVIKYLNLAEHNNKPETVLDHYKNLNHHASECVFCASCERRCPFEVNVIENMKKANKLFGY